MADAKREFRTRESLEAEKRTRDMVPALLTHRGFTDVEDTRRQYGPAQSQVIDAVSPGGGPMKIHVRLCWRRDGRNQQEQKYSAAQLRANLIDDDWDLTLAQFALREEAKGISHNLLGSVDEVPHPQSDGGDEYEAEVAVGGLVVAGSQSAAVFEL